MWADTDEERDLIADVSKEIVVQVAPEEIDIYDELLEEYFDNPKPPDLTSQLEDDPLGFGFAEVIVATTPAAAAMVSAALAFLVTSVLKTSKDETVNQLKQFFTGRKQYSSDPLSLTPTQLEELRQIAHATVVRYGIDDERAEAMTNAMLVRLVLGTQAEGESRRPIRILFLASNPIGMTPLRLDEEIRSIDEGLRQSHFRDRFQIEQHWAVRISDLQRLLLRHQPDIVHFSGHGGYSSTLILEDAGGQPAEVSIEALRELFSILKGNIRCVFLNACFSQAQAAAIAEHVDAVVGMTTEIQDVVAIRFASAFYQALGYGQDIQTAFDLGVSQIRLHQLANTEIPQLLTQRLDLKELRLA